METEPAEQQNLKPEAVPTRYTDPEALYLFSDFVPGSKAHKKALEWLEKCAMNTDPLDFWKEDACNGLKAFGWGLETRSARTMGGKEYGEPVFYYDLGYSQGSGVAFAGRLDLLDLLNGHDKAHAAYPDFPTLDPATLAALDRLLSGDSDPRFSVKIRGHYHGLDFSFSSDAPDGSQDAQDLEEALEDWTRALCRHFMRTGYAELEYRSKPETLAEDAESNGFTFTAEGARMEA